MSDGVAIGVPFEDVDVRDAARSKTGRRASGEVFGSEFDFGDSWVHRCTVLRTDVDPANEFGLKPKGPVAVCQAR
jgi:hypothetical protein